MAERAEGRGEGRKDANEMGVRGRGGGGHDMNCSEIKESGDDLSSSVPHGAQQWAYRIGGPQVAK